MAGSYPSYNQPPPQNYWYPSYQDYSPSYEDYSDPSYQEYHYQDYRHPKEEFTEDEDEVDEREFTEDESDEEDCVPYQDRQPPYHNYYAPVSYHQHHHHHYHYHQDVPDDESDASVTDDSTSSETDDGFEDGDEIKESKGSRTQTNNVWRVINCGHEQKKKQKDRKEKADTKPYETKGKTRRTRRNPSCLP